MAEEKRATIRDNDVFKFKRSLKKDESVSPQAAEILSLIEHDGEITRGELVKKLEGKLTTKQPIERVLSYYKTPLVEAGLITVTVAKAEKPEKPAKEAKAKAAPKKATKAAAAA